MNRFFKSTLLVSALMRAEQRTTYKLIRTWFIVAIAVYATAYTFWNVTQMHAIASSTSPSLGFFSPRYLLSSYSGELLLLFEIGMILLMVGGRSRDTRDGFVQVLDSKPVSNLELLAGRLIGNTILMTLLAAVLVVVVFITSLGLWLFNSTSGDLIEPYSVASFLTLDLVPNLALWGAIALFVTLVLRSTLIAALICAIAAMAFYLFTVFAPTYLWPAVANVSSSVIYPSDLAPQFTSAMIVGNRIGLILVTIGLLVLSARLFPRRDGTSRALTFSAGLGGILAGVCMFSALVLNATSHRDEFNRLAEVHKALSTQPRADILHISGGLTIHPGENLDVSYDISIKAPSRLPEELHFAFNPGMEIETLLVDDKPVSYEFRDGLIYLSTTGMEEGRKFDLSLSAHGEIDISFGYFDAAFNEYTIDAPERLGLSQLGLQKGVFHSKFVALTPAIKWYPTAGSAYDEGNYEHHPRDQFTVDLEVVAPAGWTIAGPGTREHLTTQDQHTFRFAPQSTLPEIALFGAVFVQRSMNIADVEFELLMSPKHMRNVELFTDARSLIEERVGNALLRARELGIPYPYKAFTIVEVPSVLRVYGGGWRMDSVQALPGLLMMRETGFPTAFFKQRFVSTAHQSAETNEHAETLYQFLKVYFENDVTGGNPFIGATRNFLDYQTYPTGRGAMALAYLTDALASKVVASQIGFFSAYVARDRFELGYIGPTRTASNTWQVQLERVTSQFLNYIIYRPHNWEAISRTPLAELHRVETPEQALNAMILKGVILTELVWDTLGADEVGRFLGEIRSRHQDGTYTVVEFNRIAEELQIPIATILGDWLEDASLPGFQTYEPKVVRLPDDSEGNPLYQTTFYLTNEEDVPGHFKLSFEEAARLEQPEGVNETPPLRIEGNAYMQVALQSEYPISKIYLNPYVSLNRYGITLDVDQPSSEEPQNIEQLPLLSPVEWRPNRVDSIVVDDLDDGFSVSGTGSRLNPRQRFGGVFSHYRGELAGLEYDQGLPTAPSFGRLPEPQWYRYNLPTAWGKYRRTTTFVRQDVFGSTARFRTQIPTGGTWQLDFHDPWGLGDYPVRTDLNQEDQPSRTFPLTIRADDLSVALEYDQATSSLGWNPIGEYFLSDGTVDVLLEHEGVNVHADAIRWTPISDMNLEAN